MAVANDAVLLTPGSGATLATHSPSGSNTTEHQVAMLANATGHLADSMPTYGLNIPQLGLGVDSYQWEVFNHPSSGKTLTLRVLTPIIELSVANVTIGPERFALYRTTAVGSGGTASAAFESANTILANFFRLNPGDASLSSHISARTRLTSITTGASLGQIWLSSAASGRNDPMIQATHINQLMQGVNFIPQREFGEELSVPPGQGVALREGNLVGVGAIGWLMEFTLDP